MTIFLMASAARINLRAISFGNRIVDAKHSVIACSQSKFPCDNNDEKTSKYVEPRVQI